MMDNSACTEIVLFHLVRSNAAMLVVSGVMEMLY